ncbi:hypothetical protein [Mumia zhuanghuii]|nr:hypothetical protein [Mumia zhuanghuii]
MVLREKTRTNEDLPTLERYRARFDVGDDSRDDDADPAQGMDRP